MRPDLLPAASAATTRSVSQWERALLAQWLAGTNRGGTAGIAAAYVSERSRDDPRLRNMIVIAEARKTDITYLIHRQLRESAWIVACGQTGAELGRFRTLPEALATIRPLRADQPLQAPLPATGRPGQASGQRSRRPLALR
jgi:hypothetical protein